LWRQKIVQNSAQFLTTYDFLSRISPERVNIWKIGKARENLQTPPTLDEKKFVYFGSQTKKLLTLMNLHPNGLFSGDYILALRGCCPLKFLHMLEIDKGLLAHTRRGTGVPPKKNRENLKFALKFSVLDSITSGIVEVFSLNFFMRLAITARGISSS